MFKKLVQAAIQSKRDKNLVLFMGRAQGHFIDNVKYAFLHCSKTIKNMDCWFLSFSKKEAQTLKENRLKAISREESGAYELMLNAGLLVSDDFGWKEDPVTWALLHPVKAVQLWHGIPLKAIGFPEISSGVNMNPEKASKIELYYSGYELVISTSKYFTKHAFSRCFKSKHFLECGYPRNDVLLRPTLTKSDMINVDTELYAELVKHRKSGGKVVFYIPTFRDNGRNPFSKNTLIFKNLDEYAKNNNILFILKMHPYLNKIPVVLPKTIKMVNSQSDVYPLLRESDALITDYSSVYFDYLLLDKPIVFYPFDINEYKTQNRAMLFNYNKMTPGPKVYNEINLYEILNVMLFQDKDPYLLHRQKMKYLAFDQIDYKSSDRFIKFLNDIYKV